MRLTGNWRMAKKIMISDNWQIAENSTDNWHLSSDFLKIEKKGFIISYSFEIR